MHDHLGGRKRKLRAAVGDPKYAPNMTASRLTDRYLGLAAWAGKRPKISMVLIVRRTDPPTTCRRTAGQCTSRAYRNNSLRHMQATWSHLPHILGAPAIYPMTALAIPMACHNH